MNPTITIAPYANGFAVSMPGEAVRLKTDALAAAKLVTQVKSADEQRTAIAVVARLKGLTTAVEAARVEVKAPYLAAGKAIDAKAKEYNAELIEEACALEKMIGRFQADERRRVEEEQRRQEEERRAAAASVERERQRVAEAAAAAQAAEAARVAAAAAAAQATGAAAKRKAAAAQAEAERVAAEAAQAALQAEIDAAEAEDTANEADAIIYTPPAASATGAAVREELDFEVTDLNAFVAWELQRCGPARELMFVKVEVRKADFKAYLKIIPEAARLEIPGITVKNSTKVAVRAENPETAANFAYSLPQ